MSLIESVDASSGPPDEGATTASLRRAAMLEHPTLAAAAILKGRVRESNGPWKALFALPPDVSVDSHVASLFPNVTSADRFERGLQADLATRAGGAATVRSEHMLMRRDGTVFLAELVVSVAQVEDGDRPLGGDAIWQVRDITVERTLRRELRDLEDYHRELSRHQWDMTFVIDRKGRISYASASIEGALGYRVHTMLGRPFASLLEPTHAAEAEQWLRATSRHRHENTDATGGDGFALHVLHSDGSPRVLACRPRDCFDIARIAGMVVHARDITTDDPAGRAASPEGPRLRAALLELAHGAPHVTDRVGSLLESICARVDASVVTFWAEGSDGSRSPCAVRCDGVDATPGAGFVQPPLLGVADDRGTNAVVVGDARTAPWIAATDLQALEASGTLALIEVPVIDEGRMLGWLAVTVGQVRRWVDAEVDFVVASALLLAHAVDGRQRPVSEGDAAPASVPASTTVDALTGLPDRAAAMQALALRVPAAITGEPLVAFVVGLDRFDDINDIEGLDAGDAALVLTARMLVEVAGPDGFVARLGGDEFVVLMTDPGARPFGAAIDAMLGRLAAGDDGAVPASALSASVGIVHPGPDGTEAATLLSHAGLALREAKRRGGGQAVAFNPTLASTWRLRKELEGEVEEALRRHEFTIFYQPQIALATGEVVGLEALLRWQHPVRGLLLPEAFIGAAFKRGLIDAITKFVLTQVCEQLSTWRRAGELPELPIAVNVSGRQFHDRRLPAVVASALLKSGLPARLLVLEITEKSLVDDEAALDRVVKELARLGVRIAVGEFNVGHASFRHLRQLKVAQIKIDPAFVRELPADAASVVVVEALVDLARKLQYQVIAEGVETREQFEHLRAIGCGIGQGFYLGAPMSVAEIHAYVESNRRSPIH